MNGRKSTSPSPTQPHGKNGHLSQRGMLSIVMLLVSVGTLGIAMLGGAKLAYDVLGPKDVASIGLPAAVIALAITYALGWLTAMVAIRVYGNLILPILINLLMWVCLAGILYLYVEILERLYLQEYTFMKFWKYVFVMIAGLAVLVGLHLIIEDHNLRPFSFPLLFMSMIQLGLIVYRHVFLGGKSFFFILGDLFFLFGMSGFSILMLAHVGLLDPLRTRFTNYFDRNSISIRTQD
ncbi:MAG TPA: hypothetical protein VJ972_05695 [Anaerolineales bacterium]|nr:hypothetical protein [Anaerolineales bacterium]